MGTSTSTILSVVCLWSVYLSIMRINSAGQSGHCTRIWNRQELPFRVYRMHIIMVYIYPHACHVHAYEGGAASWPAVDH